MTFKLASEKRELRRLRIGLSGPSGSGKSYTAIRLAMLLGSKVAVIDTERGSALLYEGEAPDGVPFNFLHGELQTFEPSKYTAMIDEAIRAGCDVIVIDSLSHAWMGTGGMLEAVDRAAAKSPSGNTWAAWRSVTPEHNKLVDKMLSCPAHVIATLRVKTEWDQVEKNGKKQPVAIGLAPIFRDGIEYEFTVMGDLDRDTHSLRVTKTRCAALDGFTATKAGPELAGELKRWLAGGGTEEPPARLTSTHVADPPASKPPASTATATPPAAKQEQPAATKQAEPPPASNTPPASNPPAANGATSGAPKSRHERLIERCEKLEKTLGAAKVQDARRECQIPAGPLNDLTEDQLVKYGTALSTRGARAAA